LPARESAEKGSMLQKSEPGVRSKVVRLLRWKHRKRGKKIVQDGRAAFVTVSHGDAANN
jgi:hypothetical protein